MILIFTGDTIACKKRTKVLKSIYTISMGKVGQETFRSEIKAKFCQLSQFSKNVFVMFLISAIFLMQSIFGQ